MDGLRFTGFLILLPIATVFILSGVLIEILVCAAAYASEFLADLRA